MLNGSLASPASQLIICVMASPQKRVFRVALVQMAIVSDKEENLVRAAECVAEARKNGCLLVILPECFNSPYDTNLNLCDEIRKQIPINKQRRADLYYTKKL